MLSEAPRLLELEHSRQQDNLCRWSLRYLAVEEGREEEPLKKNKQIKSTNKNKNKQVAQRVR